MTDADTPLVLIEWEDSARPAPAWLHLSDYESRSVVECASVGWLIQDDEKVKALAPNMGAIDDAEQVQACGIILIPARAVTRMVRLREGQATTWGGGPSFRPAPERKRKRS